MVIGGLTCIIGSFISFQVIILYSSKWLKYGFSCLFFIVLLLLCVHLKNSDKARQNCDECDKAREDRKITKAQNIIIFSLHFSVASSFLLVAADFIFNGLTVGTATYGFLIILTILILALIPILSKGCERDAEKYMRYLPEEDPKVEESMELDEHLYKSLLPPTKSCERHARKYTRDLPEEDLKVEKSMKENEHLYRLLIPIVMPLVKVCFANEVREFAEVSTDIYTILTFIHLLQQYNFLSQVQYELLAL